MLSQLRNYTTIFTVICASTCLQSVAAEKEAKLTPAEQRLADTVQYLASDELEGRGVATAGINKAADYLAKEFAELGLKTELFDGTPFQKFTITVESELGPKAKNHLTLVGPPTKDGGDPQRIELKLGENFNTLAIGGSDTFDLPLVFVGYGITAKDEEYDEYANLDVQGKAVVILRKEPQQNNPHSVFDGTSSSQHALFNRKVANAFEHGAAAVILVNDDYGARQAKKSKEQAWEDALDKIGESRAEFKKNENPMPADIVKHRGEIARIAKRIQQLNEELQGGFDKLLPFLGAGQSNNRKIPVCFATRKSIASILASAFGKEDLAAIEKKIDKDLKPRSAALMDWRIQGETNVVHRRAEVKNVVAVLEGEGPLAGETVVVGAHYDHLGRGGEGSLAPWTKEIHNGADDNASGAAALVEIARRFANAEKKPRRRMVFIAFTGEERGLLGSAKYVREPRFPLEKTVAMVNMDMVGRLADDKLIVHGTGTAEEFEHLVKGYNHKYKFTLTTKPGGFGPSDHSSFYAKQIPVFHIFTGTHNDYHRPSDDFDKINIKGMSRVTDFVGDITEWIVDADERPTYQEVKQPKLASRGGDRPYLGSIPDFSQEVDGYALMGVSKGSPADEAGLKSGDVIIKFGESKIGGLEDIDSALRKFKAFDKVKVIILRDKKEMVVNVTLGPPK